MNTSRAVLASLLLCALAFVVRVHAAAPTGRYVVSNGTVYDTKTRLTWEQTPSSSTFTQAAATTRCAGLSLPGSGWRVPKISELLTIVDLSTHLPAIDTSVFMNTGNTSYQTSTAFVDPEVPGYIWYVLFGDGNSTFDEPGAARVRCVR